MTVANTAGPDSTNLATTADLDAIGADPSLIRDPDDYPHLQEMCDRWRADGGVS